METRRKALFPGSFDPLTRGHESIVRRALNLFDEIVIGVGNHSSKNYMFTTEQRAQMIKDVFANVNNVSVEVYTGLTVDYAKSIGCNFILRGLRNSTDFKYERDIAFMNTSLSGIETIFMLTEPPFVAINSTIIRDILKNNGDVSAFVPEGMTLPNA